jgi:LysM repeat protein
MRPSVLRVIVLLFLLLPTAASIPLAAQGEQNLCPVIVQQALNTLGQNCAGLGRNSACYGFNNIASTFSQPVPDGFFSRASDKTELVILETIQTAPLDLSSQEWGVAVLSAQANIPGALPGQAVTFLLLGDASLTNAVDPAEANPGVLTGITGADTDLREAATTESASLRLIPAGTVLEVDARSADGLWLRALPPAGPGWLLRTALNPNPLFDQLPPEGEQRFGPMQAFTFRTGLGDPQCAEAPSVVAVRSPQGLTVDLNANGANIQLGSLIIMQLIPPGNQMRITVVEGQVVLDAGTPFERTVSAGFSSTRCVVDDGESITIGADCGWTEPEPIPPDFVFTEQAVLATYEELGFTVDESPAGDACVPGQTITYSVVRGDTLASVSRRFSTSIGAIMRANGLTDPDILPLDASLTIPCGEEAPIPSQPNPPPAPNPPPPASDVDCTPFRGTSPLDGLAYGTNTFYWDPAPGATGYRINIYNVGELGGRLMTSFTAAAGQTSLAAPITIENSGHGFSFAWEVQALGPNGVACSSGPFQVPRQPQGPLPPEPSMTPTLVPTPSSTDEPCWECNN